MAYNYRGCCGQGHGKIPVMPPYRSNKCMTDQGSSTVVVTRTLDQGDRSHTPMSMLQKRLLNPIRKKTATRPLLNYCYDSPIIGV